MTANVANVLPGPYADESAVSLTLGSGNNRAIVLLAHQNRSPSNIDGLAPTLNGVSATIAVEVAGITSRALQIAYWPDAAAPSTAGTYTLSWAGAAGGVVASILECTNIDQTTPVRKTYTIDTDYPAGIVQSGTTVAFTQLQGITGGVVTGDLMLGTFYQSTATTTIAGSGVTTVIGTYNTTARFYGIDASGHTLNLDQVKDGATTYFCLAALKAADTSTPIYMRWTL